MTEGARGERSSLFSASDFSGELRSSWYSEVGTNHTFPSRLDEDTFSDESSLPDGIPPRSETIYDLAAYLAARGIPNPHAAENEEEEDNNRGVQFQLPPGELPPTQQSFASEPNGTFTNIFGQQRDERNSEAFLQQLEHAGARVLDREAYEEASEAQNANAHRREASLLQDGARTPQPGQVPNLLRRSLRQASSASPGVIPEGSVEGTYSSVHSSRHGSASLDAGVLEIVQ
eukprot:TRINITY_DN74623_c0_g1_i1.p1 TRINITY_DN74623_c0_g1~~TRINITY_DN74623_c0_g1_i1.p1  ORF type:complete len:243 (-),score=51.65 TRINITY_DN74623_c0_g1_i1:207-899(-)